MSQATLLGAALKLSLVHRLIFTLMTVPPGHRGVYLLTYRGVLE